MVHGPQTTRYWMLDKDKTEEVRRQEAIVDSPPSTVRNI
jgi:hypothetical protein